VRTQNRNNPLVFDKGAKAIHNEAKIIFSTNDIRTTENPNAKNK
jgi:hypothetical protein